MSEKGYTKLAQNSYAVIRNPRHHVLSQYFHCAESEEALMRKEKRGEPMIPPLDDWLVFWIEKNNTPVHGAQFGCYDPRSMQSRYVDYKPQNKSRLQQKFTVIGPLDELDKTICVMFIHWTGWVPECCVCTEEENANARIIQNEKATSHGVKNHGASFNTTASQDSMINMLIETDMALYQHTKQLFGRQVEVTEKELNITLCKRIRRNEKWKFSV